MPSEGHNERGIMSAPTQVGGVGGWDTEIGAALSLDRERPRFYSPNEIMRMTVNHNNAMCLTLSAVQ